LFFVETAYAQAAAGEVAKPSMLEQMFPMLILFGVLYFLILRPQAKRARSQEDFITKIKVGDNVITSGGLLGKIQGITEKFVTLEISEGVRVKMLKSQLAAPFAGETK
jgi:preprotein translocase subunit YajC